ncbi:MAG: helix-turn-helix transcriptional regulator [Ktedonobacterales bacterium]|nr:helix-turn-helix transcriptional regulator [Ktedonobacterales bacterium]
MERRSTLTYTTACPTRQVLAVIAERWAAVILGLLEAGPARFSALHRQIGGISQKMLTQNLRHLERSGLVQRTVYAEVPPHVEYTLTPLGQTLCGPLAELRAWSEANIMAITTAQQAYTHQ